ncbi:hypothetical protein AB0P45_37090, partial [Streptomyces niveus]|uniref:hypothetical protein n=1 Tax=Streptomyces niveus TaxID=193462 RepID=UPI0034219B7E
MIDHTVGADPRPGGTRTGAVHAAPHRTSRAARRPGVSGRSPSRIHHGSTRRSRSSGDNDKRTKTTYPGGTTQSVTLDNSGRPTAIKAA